MNADEFSYHMGGALYIPQKRAPSPEPVASSAVAQPEAVPSSAAAAETTTELSTANTLDPYDSEWQAPNKEGEPNESEWDTSDVEKDPSAPGDGNTHNLPQSSASRTKTKYQQECWNEMYESLKAFHQINGHVKVPSNSSDAQVKKLYRWLGNQRMRYRAMVDQRPVANVRPMTSEERNKLNTLGVNLVRDRTKAPWDEMYESLEAFRQTNGHVKVPSNSSDVQVKKLYIWLGHQRTRYKAMVDPRSTVGCQGFKGRPMTSEEREKLTALGVDLGLSQRIWEENYVALKQLQEKHGHVRVSTDKPKRTCPKESTPAPSAKRMRQDDHGDDLVSASEEATNAKPHDTKEETFTNPKNDAVDFSREEEEHGGEAESVSKSL